jgi:hypothetical protein
LDDHERHPKKHSEGQGGQGGRVCEAVLLTSAEPEDEESDRRRCQDRAGDIQPRLHPPAVRGKHAADGDDQHDDDRA